MKNPHACNIELWMIIYPQSHHQLKGRDMQIKTKDPSPKKMWVIGVPSRREWSKLARRTKTYSSGVRFTVAVVVMAAFLAFPMVVFLFFRNGTNERMISVIMFGFMVLAILALWWVSRPGRSQVYLVERAAERAIFMEGTPAYRLFVGTSTTRDQELRKRAIDARLLSFESLAQTQSRGEHSGLDDFWFLRTDCTEVWGWLRNLHAIESGVEGIVGRLQEVEWDIHNELTARFQRELDQCTNQQEMIERRRQEYRVSRAPSAG